MIYYYSIIQSLTTCVILIRGCSTHTWHWPLFLLSLLWLFCSSPLSHFDRILALVSTQASPGGKLLHLLLFKWSFGWNRGGMCVDISPCFITSRVLCHPSLPTSVPARAQRLCVCVCTLNWLMNASLGWWALQGQTRIQRQEVDLKYHQNLLWLDTSWVSTSAQLCSFWDRCHAPNLLDANLTLLLVMYLGFDCTASVIVLLILWGVCFSYVIKWISGKNILELWKLQCLPIPFNQGFFGKVGECCTVNLTRARRQASSWSSTDCQHCLQRSYVIVLGMKRACVFVCLTFIYKWKLNHLFSVRASVYHVSYSCNYTSVIISSRTQTLVLVLQRPVISR